MLILIEVNPLKAAYQKEEQVLQYMNHHVFVRNIVCKAVFERKAQLSDEFGIGLISLLRKSIFFDAFRDYLKMHDPTYLGLLILTSKIIKSDYHNIVFNNNGMRVLRKLGIQYRKAKFKNPLYTSDFLNFQISQVTFKS